MTTLTKRSNEFDQVSIPRPTHSKASILRSVIATDPKDRVALLMRVTLGVVMFPHGAQHVLGWFGGYGFSGTMGFFTGQMGLPTSVSFLVLMAEFLGSLGLIAGLLTRVAAVGISAVMAGAIMTVHLGNGFFMNWLGNQKGEGYEYHLLVLGLAVAILIRGAGSASIDAALSRDSK